MNKSDFDSMLARFVTISEKRYGMNDATIRNQHVAISNIENQLDQLTNLINNRLPLKNPNPKPKPHVMAIFAKEDTIFETLLILNELIK